MLRVMSFNANGIRSAARKGFFDWMAGQAPDIVCIQETKAQEHQLAGAPFHPPGYHAYFHDAQKPGYSGVAVYSRREPDGVVRGLGMPDVDAEGRYLELRFGRLRVASVYVHSGSSSEERQRLKFNFMDRFLPRLRGLARSRGHWLLCGDWNIAHKPIDLKNWRSNQKNSGFLPEERAWMDTVFAPPPAGAGLVDVFRTLNTQPEQYTWWSNRGQARAKNVGWRIDYHIATEAFAQRAVAASIHRAPAFSDHAPLTLDYDHDYSHEA